MPVIDGCNNLPLRLRTYARYAVGGLGGHRPEFHTDIPRLRAGGVGAQFWSVFVPSRLPEPEAVVATMEQVDAVYRMAAAYPDDLVMAFTADGIERATSSGRIACLLGVEGGHSLAESLGVLRTYARLGVRYVTLTYNHNTSWADSAADVPAAGGLNAAGRAVVAEMQRLGVLVDLAHAAVPTMHAALDTATAPVIFSHSSARAVTDHYRNVPDEVLARLRDNGGVVQVTFVPQFVSNEVAQWYRDEAAERERLGLPADDEPFPRAPHPAEDPLAVVASLPPPIPEPAPMRAWRAAHPRPVATLAQVADHVGHVREVAGVDHAGLGGDFDGTPDVPRGLEDVSGYPRLLAELGDRGWSEADLEKLTGRNMLRVLRAAEDRASEPLWPA